MGKWIKAQALDKEKINLIESLCADGHYESVVSASLGIHSRTWEYWKSEALKIQLRLESAYKYLIDNRFISNSGEPLSYILVVDGKETFLAESEIEGKENFQDRSEYVASEVAGCTYLRPDEEKLLHFIQAIKEGKAKAQISHLDNIILAGKDKSHWQASAWWLERMFPKLYGKNSPDVAIMIPERIVIRGGSDSRSNPEATSSNDQQKT